MANIERKHEVLTEPLGDDLLRRRASDGWRPVGVVWERTVETAVETSGREAVPFGLRVGPDCSSLEPAPEEIGAMVQMLRHIVEERSFAQIADALNTAGYRTRAGDPWNQTMVFHMLPRLIEVAPSVYSSEEWLALKPKLSSSSKG